MSDRADGCLEKFELLAAASAPEVRKRWEIQRVLACAALPPAQAPRIALRLPLRGKLDTGSIRQSFRELCLLVHPDKNHGRPESVQAFGILFRNKEICLKAAAL